MVIRTNMMFLFALLKCIKEIEMTSFQKKEDVAAFVEVIQNAESEIIRHYDGLMKIDGELIKVSPSISIEEGVNKSREEIVGKLRQRAWIHIINSLKLKWIMSPKEYNKLCDVFYLNSVITATIPEITADAVNAFVEKHFSYEVFASSIVTVFNQLTYQYVDKTTPIQTKVTLKVLEEKSKILPSKKFSVSYHGGDLLNAMERAFYCVENMNVVENILYFLPYGPKAFTPELVRAIENCPRESDGSVETDFFKCKLYNNGNCHITFKRLDLLERINNIAKENLNK